MHFSKSLLLASFTTLTISYTFTLPPLLGPSEVGTISLSLIDSTRLDPLSPTPKSRNLMLSIFYPIQHTRRYNLAAPFDPLYADFLNTTRSRSVPLELTSSLLSRAYEGAYLHPNTSSQPKILLFNPGYTGSREDYTATLSNLASLGYLVVGIDHPYDTEFIAYPDNSTVSPPFDVLLNVTDIAGAGANYTTYQAQDIITVINALGSNATFTRLIPGVHGVLDVSKIGVLGHSLGGAAAAQAMTLDSRFFCGSNMDGTFWGNTTALFTKLSKPFFLVATAAHNSTNDPSYKDFISIYPKGRYEITISGTTHEEYLDLYICLRWRRTRDCRDYLM